MKPERIKEVENIKRQTQESLKGKSFKNLSTPEKDKLLETVARMLGLIK